MHVLMMTDIYRDASLVLMYLGQEGEYTQLAVEFIIHDYWLQQDKTDLNEPPANLAMSKRQQWLGILDLASREYWTRVWIVQEV